MADAPPTGKSATQQVWKPALQRGIPSASESESHLLTWPRRILLTAVAFGGSSIYALSFAHAPERARWLPVAAAIGVAAGVSWIVFGLVLLGVTGRRPSVWHWADACLRTMAVGMTIKMTTVVANLVAPTAAGFHLAVLVAANLAMAAMFVAQARPLGVSVRAALALWFGVLNGVFAIVLAGLLTGR
ncbi:hypothetical protein LBMAG56_33330 [Verrucomicrobiota bacterium]|nr:hypothetical protein LBMAG56_33330 [Verrucomicrobiota bacterium]